MAVLRGINNVTSHLCTDNKILLRFVETSTLKTFVNRKLVSVDILQKEDVDGNSGSKSTINTKGCRCYSRDIW